MKKDANISLLQKSARLGRSRKTIMYTIFMGVLLVAPMANAQELYSFERFKAANRDYDMMPFRDMIPKALPAPLNNARVIISNFGNHCNEYFVISAEVDLKGFRLIPFSRYPTMDALKFVGNSFPSLSNAAAFSQSLDSSTRKYFDPFSSSKFLNGSAISVMACGGRVDGPELSKQIVTSPRALLPDGRKAFLVKGVFNKWSSWCVFDDEEARAKQQIPQSGFICVSAHSADTTALHFLRSIVSYSRYYRK